MSDAQKTSRLRRSKWGCVVVACVVAVVVYVWFFPLDRLILVTFAISGGLCGYCIGISKRPK